MIQGIVNAFREPVIRVHLRGPQQQIVVETDVIIDTGFNGTLTLPPTVIQYLGFTFLHQGRALLADGSESVFDVYEGEVLWFEERRRIVVDEADTEPLAGMTLLYGAELTVQVLDGGSVQITPLP